MKHAYLVLAHSDFKVLQELINALDSEGNTIFIHFDKKVKNLPRLVSNEAKICILEKREEIYWGHISIVKAQYLLWKEARLNGEFDFYHLLSGVHFPLKPIFFIEEYFKKFKGSAIFKQMNTNKNEINHKMRRIHFCIMYFRSSRKYERFLSHWLWLIILKFQKIISFRRYTNSEFYKASQWHSLPNHCVDYLLKCEDLIIKKYKNTFCPDEFFVLTELQNSNLSDNIIYAEDYLLADFEMISPRVFTVDDYDFLINSECLFSRKFSDNHLDIVLQITNHLKSLGDGK